MIFSFSIFQAHTHHLFSITSLRSVPILTVVSYTTYYDDFFYLTFSKQIFGGTDDDGCGSCLYLYLSFFPALKIHTKKCLFIYKCTYYYHLNFCHENESQKKCDEEMRRKNYWHFHDGMPNLGHNRRRRICMSVLQK